MLLNSKVQLVHTFIPTKARAGSSFYPFLVIVFFKSAVSSFIFILHLHSKGVSFWRYSSKSSGVWTKQVLDICKNRIHLLPEDNMHSSIRSPFSLLWYRLSLKTSPASPISPHLCKVHHSRRHHAESILHIIQHNHNLSTVWQPELHTILTSVFN